MLIKVWKQTVTRKIKCSRLNCDLLLCCLSFLNFFNCLFYTLDDAIIKNKNSFSLLPSIVEVIKCWDAFFQTLSGSLTGYGLLRPPQQLLGRNWSKNCQKADHRHLDLSRCPLLHKRLQPPPWCQPPKSRDNRRHWTRCNLLEWKGIYTNYEPFTDQLQPIYFTCNGL